ncbi:Ig-like and fibronectin type-III domain-containing protein 2 [Procambarus clarkii]|uniref:Ig-like and fibronectin type-III domain-containing protein 2 n=1 Tax=Procambarus clarkii TaxID=6728 RepID=UPI003744319B
MWCVGRTAFSGLLVLLPLLCPLPHTVEGSDPAPFIRNTANAPRAFREGEDILLTCVVADLGNHTVWWSKHEDGRKTILTVAERSITNDNRVSILHDRAPSYNTSIIRSGGDVWVLVIKNAKVTDKGVYVCEINSNPSLTSLYMVTVGSGNATDGVTTALRSAHNYTSCCIENGVQPQCLGFCAIHNILEGKTGIDPEACETHFPLIVKCMADLRNHVPCCERERVPDICQDLCRGEYTTQDDNIQSHFSCTAYTEVTLMCISEGVEILPMSPESPSVDVLGPTSIDVTWDHPHPGTPPPEYYVINVTTITKFDPPEDVTGVTSTDVGGLDTHDDHLYLPKRLQVKVSASQTHATIKNLSPLTWYEVSVVSVNRHGSSLPQYNLRVLTETVSLNKTETVHPELPDIVSCCSEKGVKHYRCLRNLCDPSNKYISEPDMIVCAPWATEAFSCLANDYDHSDCCKERGLPPLCVELCTGNVTKIDYKYFRCVDYFNDYRSCLLKGYNVLPGAPGKVSITNTNPTFVLLHWAAPTLLGDSVTAYHAYFRPIQPSRECAAKWFINNMEVSYHGVYTDKSPYVLENLCPDTEYEVYVQAVNKHGTGDPSERVLFRTPSEARVQRLQDNAYNVTECCRSVNLSPGCMPLCDYNARMSHVRALVVTCTNELTSLLRCAVGGRNHMPCCQRRGVPNACSALCSGSFNSNNATPTVCMPYIGNIMMCLEEGVDLLPAPVSRLHATKVGAGQVTLIWQAPDNGPNVTQYQLHYQSVDKHSASKAVFALNNVRIASASGHNIGR